MVGMRSMPGNPYGGHDLKEPLEQVDILTGTDCKPKTAVVDRSYRGVQIGGVRILMSGQKRGHPRLEGRDPSAQCDRAGHRAQEDGRAHCLKFAQGCLW